MTTDVARASVSAQLLGWPLSNHFLTTVPLIGTLLAYVIVLPSEAWLGLLPLSWFFGWSQMGGRCGTAHVNTMLHFWRRSPSMWLKAAGAYTFWGLVSATSVGMVLGVIGDWIHIPSISQYLWLGVSILGVILAAREIGFLRFPLLEWRCQTNRNWLYRFTPVQAAAMWGFHIGLGFATVITYGSFWVLVTAIIALGEASLGALIMAAYWIGRTSPLWILSPFLDRPWQVDSKEKLFRPSQGIGIACVSIVGLLMLLA